MCVNFGACWCHQSRKLKNWFYFDDPPLSPSCYTVPAYFNVKI